MFNPPLHHALIADRIEMRLAISTPDTAKNALTRFVEQNAVGFLTPQTPILLADSSHPSDRYAHLTQANISEIRFRYLRSRRDETTQNLIYDICTHTKGQKRFGETLPLSERNNR